MPKFEKEAPIEVINPEASLKEQLKIVETDLRMAQKEGKVSDDEVLKFQRKLHNVENIDDEGERVREMEMLLDNTRNFLRTAKNKKEKP